MATSGHFCWQGQDEVNKERATQPLKKSYHVVPQSTCSLGMSLLAEVETIWGKI